MVMEQKRNRFYLYCRQNGLWTREVAVMIRKGAQTLGPLPIRNVTAGYRHALIHGTRYDVPYANPPTWTGANPHGGAARIHHDQGWVMALAASIGLVANTHER